MRVWDRVREDLVERVIAEDRTPCLTLGLNWVVCPVADEPVGLRLVDDEGRFLEVPEEAQARRAETAEKRIRELEEQLRRAQTKGNGSSGAG